MIVPVVMGQARQLVIIAEAVESRRGDNSGAVVTPQQAAPNPI